MSFSGASVALETKEPGFQSRRSFDRVLSNILLVAYGPVIACTYISIHKLSDGKPVPLLGAASLLAAIVIAPFARKELKEVLFSRPFVIRSVLFAGAQTLLVAGFIQSSVSASLAIAMAGVVVSFLLHKVKDWISNRERITGYAVAALAMTAIGILQLASGATVSVLAFFGGILQGAAFFQLHAISRKGVSPLAAQAPVLLITAAFALIPSVGRVNFSTVSLLIAAVLIICSQLLAFVLNRRFDGATASIAAGTRVPASIVLDHLFFAVPISARVGMGVLLVFAGFIGANRAGRRGKR